MNMITLRRESTQTVANDVGHTDADREAMRGWMEMLRKEALHLRSEAQHMLDVAEEAEYLAGQVEKQLKSY